VAASRGDEEAPLAGEGVAAERVGADVTVLAGLGVGKPVILEEDPALAVGALRVGPQEGEGECVPGGYVGVAPATPLAVGPPTPGWAPREGEGLKVDPPPNDTVASTELVGVAAKGGEGVVAGEAVAAITGETVPRISVDVGVKMAERVTVVNAVMEGVEREERVTVVNAVMEGVEREERVTVVNAVMLGVGIAEKEMVFNGEVLASIELDIIEEALDN